MSEPTELAVLICYLRPARNKARVVAEAEAVSLLRDLEATVLPGGPLSEQGGLFWISLPAQYLPSARKRLARLGYTFAVDLVQPVSQDETGADVAVETGERRTRWRRRTH